MQTIRLVVEVYLVIAIAAACGSPSRRPEAPPDRSPVATAGAGEPVASVVAGGDLERAERLWQRAESETVPRAAAERWQEAAIAFTDLAKATGEDRDRRSRWARTAVLAWRSAANLSPRARRNADAGAALDPPPPKSISPPGRQTIEACDLAIALASDATDPELAPIALLRARIYWEHDHLDDAASLLREIVDRHRGHDVTERAVNLLLDSLNRLQRHDEIAALVVELLADQSFLRGKPDLERALRKLETVSGRNNAERLERAGNHRGCGDAYRALYVAADRSSSRREELAYNAGVCFEQARMTGAAIQMFDEISTRFSSSPLAAKAIARSANLLAASAQFDKAATRYEQYARKYGGEKDAPDALSNAVVYRIGLAQYDQAIRDTELFIQLYGRKDRRGAADALFGIATLYQKLNEPDKLIRSLERYIKQVGATRGRDRLVVAHAMIGEVLWNRSCNVHASDGSCVARSRRRARSRRPCGVDAEVAVVARDRRLTREAKRHFELALGELGRVRAKDLPAGDESDASRRVAVAEDWAAAARFYLAEPAFERFLAARPGRGQRWTAAQAEAAVAANRAYEPLNDAAAPWRLAAIARRGQIARHVADGSLRDAADCTQADPLYEPAVERFSFCLEAPTHASSTRWFKLCERELQRLRPREFPRMREARPVPSVGPILRLETAAELPPGLI